jgi:VWFA-related protein
MIGASRRLAVHVSAVALGAVAALVAQSPAGRPTAPQAQPPTFKAGVNFVQVDVYPTLNGAPVGDLSKDDFEVAEDGVAQSISSFEHISAAPAPGGTPPRDPRSTTDERELVADPRHRLFVIFLDSYHATDWTAWHNGTMRNPGSDVASRPREKQSLGPQAIDKALVSFLERFIGPNDLVAAMAPEMNASDMVFSRRPERFAEWVSTAWARRFGWDDMEPEEERWARCYPPDPVGDQFRCYPGIWEEMVLRRRESLTLRALEDTVYRLGALREGRKGVLVVSEGWPMYRPEQKLARPLPSFSRPGCPADPPATPGVFIGPDGRLQQGADPRNPQNLDRSACDAARLKLALLDDHSSFQRLLDRANRETVTFYPVDPRGLAVFDTPMNAKAPSGEDRGGVNDDLARLRGRLETLRDLASATDGFLSESNDFDASMKRIADDLSEYYLLGYNSSNAKLDGKFRKITVRIKRPGVQVRARRGYLAATEAEMSARATPPPADPIVRLRESALASLGTTPSERVVRITGGYEWRVSSKQGPAAPTLWGIAELAESVARQPEWREGAEALLTVADSEGTVIASERGRLSAASRVLAWAAADAVLRPGEYLLRVTLRSAAGGSPAVDQLRVNLPAVSADVAGRPGTPRMYRRGPSTGLAYVQTAESRFRRVERLRLTLSLPLESAAISARLLDRRGQELAVPVSVQLTDQDGRQVALAEAPLASLAPGDYLLEVAVGEGQARQVVVVAIRVVP